MANCKQKHETTVIRENVEQGTSIEGDVEGNPQCWCDGFYLKIYIAEARAEDTQDIVDICNDNGEESEDEMVIETECTPDCCSLTCNKPNQPTEKLCLLKPRSSKQWKSRQARYSYVQSCWFQKYRWLSLCTTRSKLFCFVCVTAVQHNLLTFSKNIEANY